MAPWHPPQKLPAVSVFCRPPRHDRRVTRSSARQSAAGLPEAAAAALRTVLAVERAAHGVQRQAARRATGRLILAYLDVGWTQPAVAAAMGLSARTIGARAAAARATSDPVAGVVIAAPTRPRRTPGTARVDELDWLRPGQAAALMGVHVNQLWTWRRAGLLPATRVTAGGHCRYARSDLLAVLHLRGGRKILPASTAARHGNPDLGRRQVAAVPRKLTRRPEHRTGVNEPARVAANANYLVRAGRRTK